MADHGRGNEGIAKDVEFRSRMQTDFFHPTAVVGFEKDHETAGSFEGVHVGFEILGGGGGDDRVPEAVPVGMAHLGFKGRDHFFEAWCFGARSVSGCFHPAWDISFGRFADSKTFAVKT